jgi:outer membrane protein OmpA-like peptidoglycan-associated protein
MIKLYNILLISICCLLASTNIYSQDAGIFGKESFAIHPKGGLLYNYYTSNYSSFQGTVDCGLFTFGKGYGWNGSLVIEKDFSGDFQLGLGVGYFVRNGASTLDNTYQARDQNTGRTTLVTLQNKMDAKLSYLEISPEIRFILMDKFINGPIRFMSGFRVGIPIQKEFDQTESIVSPANATFVNSGGERTTVREMAKGTINSTTTQFGLSAGLENMLKIGNHNFFTQQLVFDYNFNNIVSDAEWKTFAVRLDLGFRFTIQETPEEIKIPEPEPEPYVEPVIVKEVPKPLPILNFTGEFDEPTTRLETGNEILSTLPLVNSIFFDKNSSEIPPYYLKSSNSEIDMYSGDAVNYHKYILEVVSKIVKENPSSRIMLEGATSGLQNEPKGLELAKARTESVKSALVDLGIPVNKISYRVLAAPRFPSNQQYPEGIEENQRVDIQITDAPLQQYVNMVRFAELNGNFVLNIDYKNYPDGTKAMTSVNDTRIVYDKPGQYKVPFKQRIGIEDKSFNVTAKVNVDGSELVESKSLNLEKINTNVVKLSLKNFEALLRFNYNSSDLTEENQNLLKQLVQKLPDGSTILIIGSADMLGTAESNQLLATERARKTEYFIKNLVGSRVNIETTTNLDKFSDKTPQGRFLNRSIKIRVK